MQNNKEKRILNISEAARYSGYSRGMIELWMNDGLIPYEELPGRGKGIHKNRRIRQTDLEAFLEKYYIKGENRNQHFSQGKVVDDIFLLPKKSSKAGRGVDL